jgi:membrane protein
MLEDHQPAGPGVPQSPAGLPASPPPADADAAPATVPASDHAAGRFRRLTDHGRQWLTSEQARLQARRQRSGMVDAGFLVQELDARVGGGILAGALAFRIFLFMVPVAYVIFTVLGVVSRALGHDPAQVAKDAGITGVLASTVVKVADQSAWTLATLVLGAVVTMIITTGSLLKALYVVHWLIWRVPRAKPAGLAPKLVLIGLAVAGSALGVAINDVRTSAGTAGAVLAVLLTTGLSFAGWWWVSWKLPHAPVPAAALIPGAVLMAIGADVLQLLTTYWIGNLVARKTSTYGAVGIALAVLLWVYILGRIMVGSAGLNAALYYRREDRTGQAGRGQLAIRPAYQHLVGPADFGRARVFS